MIVLSEDKPLRVFILIYFNGITQNRLNIIIGEGEFIIPALVLGLCNQIPEELKNQKFVYRVNKDSEYFPEDISNVFLVGGIWETR